ncbi:HAD-like protein [Durotheca rogersii]|uniref:HAD-like protein n=1 Tax=Durotheca rogersii TaxID=419775 RepID=UPI00221EA4A4|nr:HAD-like protein [Durotheca rogersii]KAI5857302.1 HAD-like protein [Durotheca rogersii]
MAQPAPRRFAPLGDAPAGHHGLPQLKGVVFDMDGTLCRPQNYMFAEMRAALGIGPEVDILEHVYGLPSAGERDAAMAAIRAVERRAMARQEPQPGLLALVAYLEARGLPKGICTRNFEQPVAHLLARFLPGRLFAPVVTRDFRPPKPDPAGILFIARRWGLLRVPDPAADPADAPDASGLIMVGDSIDDMTAGRRAGAATVLLVNDVNRHLADHDHTDLVIERLDDLVDVLERGFVGRDIGTPASAVSSP